MNSDNPRESGELDTEQILRETLKRLELATAAGQIGLWEFSAVTREVHFSPEWKRQLGYADHELSNQFEAWESRLHPDDRSSTLEAVEDYVSGRRPEYVIEFRLRHKDGSYRWIYARADKQLDDSGKLVRVYGCHLDISERKETELRLKALATQMTLAEERERRRIATELHDMVSQSLALARLQIARAQKWVSDNKVGALLAELTSSLLQVSRSTRQIMSDLSSPQINELGLNAAISEWLEEQIGARHGLEVVFRSNGCEPQLGGDMKALVFRNVRELLINIVKHAQARHVDVALEQDAQQVTITVQDDGVGFNPNDTASAKPSQEGGFGLFSIQERMSDLGGSLKLVSAPGKGCTATLTLPVETRV